MKVAQWKRHRLLLVLFAAALAVLVETTVRGNHTVFSATNAYRAWLRVRTMTVTAYRSRIKDPGPTRVYFKSHPVPKLQIGAGGNDPDGWLNTDIEPLGKEVLLDATGRFPFPDGSFQYVFSEHVIEHVSWESGIAMLKECYRVMAPGAKIRTITPNLTKFVQLLGGPADPDAQRFIGAKLRLHRWPMTPVPGAYIFNQQVRDWGHQFLYDPQTLRKSLELAGFKQITEHRVAEKTDPVFQEVEKRTRLQGSDLWVINNWEAMAFEAVRPFESNRLAGVSKR
jgi:predicted SAM-dependent methyltransferase